MPQTDDVFVSRVPPKLDIGDLVPHCGDQSPSVGNVEGHGSSGKKTSDLSITSEVLLFNFFYRDSTIFNSF